MTWDLGAASEQPVGHLMTGWAGERERLHMWRNWQVTREHPLGLLNLKQYKELGPRRERWRGGGGSNGTITLAMVGAGTQEAMRFSLTRKGGGPQLPIN